MYEHKLEPLLPGRLFYRRVTRHALFAGATLVVCLAAGMAGYHHYEGMSWVDAFVNASMILSGMGPVQELKTTGGKIFAGCYAIFSGVAFLTIIGVVLAPVIHRMSHIFHVELTNAKDDAKR